MKFLMIMFLIASVCVAGAGIYLSTNSLSHLASFGAGAVIGLLAFKAFYALTTPRPHPELEPFEDDHDLGVQ